MKEFDLVQYGGENRDDPISVKLNGVELAYATYDEHGSSGMEIVEDLARNLSKVLNVPVRYEQEDED